MIRAIDIYIVAVGPAGSGKTVILDKVKTFLELLEYEIIDVDLDAHIIRVKSK